MSLATHPLRLPDFVDDRPVGRFQYGVVTLLRPDHVHRRVRHPGDQLPGPHIAVSGACPNSYSGRIFSSALAGLMVGYLALAPLSDRFGHKRVLGGGHRVVRGVHTGRRLVRQRHRAGGAALPSPVSGWVPPLPVPSR